MKKVLFLLKVPPPVHGSTLMNQTVMKSDLLKQSFDCCYFPLSISKDVSDIGKFSFRKIGKVLNSYISLFKTMRKFSPDIVYFALSPYGAAFIKDFCFNVIIRMFGKKVLFHLHGRGIREQGEKNFVFHWLYKRLFKGNYAICLSQELTSDVKPYIKDPFIVPNGIKKSCIDGLKKSDQSGDFTIAYLSNFIRSKGVLELIAALAIVRQRGNSFGVSLIGKEADVTTNELTDYIKILNLEETVKHIGPLYEDQKYRALMEADLFVFPTHYSNEAQPLVIMEAMQCGLPVISTTEGAIPSLVDEGVTGSLIKKSDNNFRLADKVEFFIKNPDISREMGKAGKKKFDKSYTIEIFEQNLVRVLNRVLDHNKN